MLCERCTTRPAHAARRGTRTPSAPTCSTAWPLSAAEDEARAFDQRVMDASMTKLGLDDEERNERTATMLRRRLRDGGGWGLTPAARTSSAAFLGSLAACHAEPTFVPYCDTAPLPQPSLLHAWIDNGLQRVRQAAPGDQYQADIETLLPATPGDFYSSHSSAEPSVTTKLQRH